jgi:hypothetical protein
MGRDSQPQNRQQARRIRKEACRKSRARILIISEGSKTEPLYLQDIRAAYRLPSASIRVRYSQRGTSPKQVAEYAIQMFDEGDAHIGISPRSFDEVYVVFDRDDHQTYFEALEMVRNLRGKKRNDNKDSVLFTAIASVPCFELWILLHYEDISAPIHRMDVVLRLEKYISGYTKGARGIFSLTRGKLGDATRRAQELAAKNSPDAGIEPYTGMHELVVRLIDLNS